MGCGLLCDTVSRWEKGFETEVNTGGRGEGESKWKEETSFVVGVDQRNSESGGGASLGRRSREEG